MWYFGSDLKSIWPESYFSIGPVSKLSSVRTQIYHRFVFCIEVIFLSECTVFHKCSHEGKMPGVHNMQLMNVLGNNDREMRVLCQQRTHCFTDFFINLDRVI